MELLQGEFSKGVMERLCRQDTGLFPRPSEIGSLAVARTMRRCASTLQRCSMASARGSMKAQSLFRLRAVDETELLSDLGSALPDTRTKRDGANPGW